MSDMYGGTGIVFFAMLVYGGFSLISKSISFDFKIAMYSLIFTFLLETAMYMISSILGE